MILDLVYRLSRSTSRSNSKCRGEQFCCNYFQKNFRGHKKRRVSPADVNNGGVRTGSGSDRIKVTSDE